MAHYPTDYQDFENGVVEVHYPNIFAPHNVFEVIIDPDDLFEPQEEIVVSLRRPNTLHPPEPFNGTKTESAENSVVRTPDDDRIIFDLQSTKIIIRGGNLITKVYMCMGISTLFT